MAVTPGDQLLGRNGHVGPEDPVAFRCDVLQVSDHAVITVRGDVDLATAPTLLQRMSSTLTLPISGLTVDLAYVTFLVALGILVPGCEPKLMCTPPAKAWVCSARIGAPGAGRPRDVRPAPVFRAAPVGKRTR
jgi:hypothetical protein